MIQINGLEKKLSDDFTLKIDKLTVKDGERVAIIGANGSGKSTLLRLIAGIIAPDRGEIAVSGAKIGYCPQNAYSFRGTAEQNVRLGAKKGADIEKIIENCGIADIRGKQSSKLSGGEKQRMCFARMMAGNFGVLLLDEPFSALDIEYSASLCEYLKSECENNNTTLLMSTHLPAQALCAATKVLIMNSGRVSEYTDIEKLKTPESEFGRKFIEQWRIN